MVSNALKALPLVILLALPAAAGSGDEPSEKKQRTEKKTIVTEDGVFSTDGDEPLVVRLPQVRRGYLGVRLLEMTPELRAHYGAPRDAGVLVASVEAESPAQKAGIQVGDIITKADGERIETPRDLARTARGMRSGETLKVEVSRDKATRELSVTIQERAGQEIDLGDLGREIGRDFGRDFGREFGRHAWVFRTPENLDRFQRKLDDLDKRLKDLEKKLAR